MLGLDNSGRLVVAELKRESDVGIHVQALMRGNVDSQPAETDDTEDDF